MVEWEWMISFPPQNSDYFRKCSSRNNCSLFNQMQDEHQCIKYHFFLGHLFNIFVICLALCSYKPIRVLYALTLLGLCP